MHGQGLQAYADWSKYLDGSLERDIRMSLMSSFLHGAVLEALPSENIRTLIEEVLWSNPSMFGLLTRIFICHETYDWSDAAKSAYGAHTR